MSDTWITLFDNIRATNVSLFEKIIFIGGDIEIDGLQMDHQDEMNIINDVKIIFHCAANIKFNDPIKNAVNINVTGTLRVLQLAAKVKNLEVFSYMSTAFCQSFQEDLDEKQYKTCVDAKKIIEKTQLMDSESLVHLEREL